jgi:hypothetical protein
MPVDLRTITLAAAIGFNVVAVVAQHARLFD